MSAKLWSLSTVCVQLGPRKLSVMRSSVVSVGCLSIEMNGRTVGTFRTAPYIVGVKQVRKTLPTHTINDTYVTW